MQLTVYSYHFTYTLQGESTVDSCLNVKEVLVRRRSVMSSLSDCNWTWTQNHLVRQGTLNYLTKLTIDWALFRVLISTVQLTVYSYHVTYAFQSESTVDSCLNVKELLARRRRVMASLSDCNWIWTQNCLVRQGTLNQLTKLTKWFSFVLSTYLYSAIALCFYHVTDLFQSEPTLYSWLHVKKLLAGNRRVIWSLSECDMTRI